MCGARRPAVCNANVVSPAPSPNPGKPPSPSPDHPGDPTDPPSGPSGTVGGIVVVSVMQEKCQVRLIPCRLCITPPRPPHPCQTLNPSVVKTPDSSPSAAPAPVAGAPQKIRPGR